MMNVPLYIGDKKAKDKIVSAELQRFTEGNRCDRVKDLILKGLIYEGRAGIPEHLLEDKYVLRESLAAKPKARNTPQLVTTQEEPKDIPEFVRLSKPSFEGELVKKKHTNDDDLENKI